MPKRWQRRARKLGALALDQYLKDHPEAAKKLSELELEAMKIAFRKSADDIAKEHE